MKNQKRPPHGKPHSIIRMAGIFREKKVLHPLFCFCVGIILSKSHLDFVVSVPVSAFLLKYTAKRGETMRFCENTKGNGAFRKRNTKKRTIFTKSAVYSMHFAEIHNGIHYFLSFNPFLLVKS